MNIFVLDRDPAIAAQLMCDKHVVKMILETAQMLCAVWPAGTAPYKKTHANHPCTIWAGATRANYTWLLQHGIALCNEYSYRYGKTHASEKVIAWAMSKARDVPEGDLTPFAQAMPEKYRQEDAVQAYRAYYVGDKGGFAKWSQREIPEWFKTAA